MLAEYYPRAGDPVRGIWSHRQTLAARDAGAEIRVLVLHRPLPPLTSVREHDLGAALRELRQPASATLDGIEVEYLRYLSPPRPWSYGSWGAWAAPPLRRRLRSLHETFPYELMHAHYAVPAGDALRRAAPQTPLVVSVHGHDVFGVGTRETRGRPGQGRLQVGADRLRAGRASEQGRARYPRVAAVLRHARLVLANSTGTAERCLRAGAREVRVVHLGSDVPGAVNPPPTAPTLVTVAHLAGRKRHADVVAAVALLRERHPEIRYVIVGDGPEREPLRAQIATLGLQRHVELRGALPHEQALTAARSATLFVMPSVDEAFGVAYVEAMAGGVPAIGARGEAGPQEIARAGGGIELVAAGDVPGLVAVIDRLLSEPDTLAALRGAARENVAGAFTWGRCGTETVRAYAYALSDSGVSSQLHSEPAAPAPAPIARRTR